MCDTSCPAGLVLGAQVHAPCPACLQAQVPRGHPWSLVRPRQLLALEKSLLEGQCSTGSAPAAAAVSHPGATRGAQDVTPAANAEAPGPSASPRATHKKQAKQALAHTAARQAGPSGTGSGGGAGTGRKKKGAAASGPRTGGTGGSERGNDADAEEDDGDDEDEDGLRVVWDSAPPAAVRAAREAWRAVPLRERVAWSQTSDEVNVWIKLPQGKQMMGSVSRICDSSVSACEKSAYSDPDAEGTVVSIPL